MRVEENGKWLHQHEYAESNDKRGQVFHWASSQKKRFDVFF